MNDKSDGDIPTRHGFSGTPRSNALSGLLTMAQEDHVARFIIVRLVDAMDLGHLLTVYQEVSETLESRAKDNPLRLITPRDEN